MIVWVTARTKVPTIDWAGEREAASVESALAGLTRVVLSLYDRVRRPMYLPSGACVTSVVREALERRLIENLTDGQGPLYTEGLTEILLRAATRDLARRHHVYTTLRDLATGTAFTQGQVLKIQEHHYIGPGQFWCGKLVESFFDPGGRYYHFCVIVERRGGVALVVPMSTKLTPAVVVPVLLERPSNAVCGAASLVSDNVLGLGRPSPRFSSLEAGDITRIARATQTNGLIRFETSGDCPGTNVVVGYVKRALAPHEHRAVEAHFLSCYPCVEATRQMIEEDPDASNPDDEEPEEGYGQELRSALAGYWERHARAASGTPLEKVMAQEGVCPGQIWSTRAVGILVPGLEEEDLTAEDFDSVPHLVLVLREPEGRNGDPQHVRVVPLTPRIDLLDPGAYVLGAGEGPLGYPVGVELYNEQEMLVQNLGACLGSVASLEPIERARDATLLRDGGAPSSPTRHAASAAEGFGEREWRQTAYLRVPVETMRARKNAQGLLATLDRLTRLPREVAARLCQTATMYADRIASARADAEALAFATEDRTAARLLSLRYVQADAFIDLDERASGEVVVTVSLQAVLPGTASGTLILAGADGGFLEYELSVVAGAGDQWAVGSVVVAGSLGELVGRLGMTIAPVYIACTK